MKPFSTALTRFRELSVFQQAFVLGALITLPGLGAVGLWDPWETHYVEVGRQMLVRGDFIHPYWQNTWFFSKPPLTFWLSAMGLWLSGAQPLGEPGSGPLPHAMEWFVRLPFALLLIAAGAFLADSVSRAVGRRAGLFTALVWCTTPMVLFISRQVMTDGPFVSLTVISLCAFERARRDAGGWWWLASVAMAFGVLAKGLVGLLPLPIVAAAWLAIEGKGALETIRRAPRWAMAALPVIAAPWFIVMSRFEGRDDEGRNFVERFFLYDHFNRFASGVHTTTPGGTFTYFIDQGAWALTPWLVLVPAAFQVLVTARREGERWRAVTLWSIASLATFALFTASATRFHHYVFSMIPPLVVLVAIAADSVWDDVRAFRPALLGGLVLQGLALKDLIARPKNWLDLFTYNHDRPYPNELVTAPLVNGSTLTLPMLLTVLAVAAGVLAVIALLRGRGESMLKVQLGFAVLIATFLAFHHWPRLSRHWTQRELVERYLSERAPGERLGAFLMNWKGETLYTRNEVTQIAGRDVRSEVSVLTTTGGARTWFLVEHNRVELLRQALPPGFVLTPIDATTTNKFVLAVASR